MSHTNVVKTDGLPEETCRQGIDCMDKARQVIDANRKALYKNYSSLSEIEAFNLIY